MVSFELIEKRWLDMTTFFEILWQRSFKISLLIFVSSNSYWEGPGQKVLFCFAVSFYSDQINVGCYNVVIDWINVLTLDTNLRISFSSFKSLSLNLRWKYDTSGHCKFLKKSTSISKSGKMRLIDLNIIWTFHLW